MARKAGSSSSVAIPLSKLVALLNANQIVKVSKGWLDAVEEANNISFGVSDETESGGETATAPAPASAKAPDVEDARPSVDIG